MTSKELRQRDKEHVYGILEAARHLLRAGCPLVGYMRRCWYCGTTTPVHASDCEWAALRDAYRGPER